MVRPIYRTPREGATAGTGRVKGDSSVENKPVARLLFKNCKVGKEIIPEMFAAVAEILAFVYRTNRYKYYTKGQRVTA